MEIFLRTINHDLFLRLCNIWRFKADRIMLRVDKDNEFHTSIYVVNIYLMQQKYQEKEKSPSGFFAVAISSIFPYRSPPPTFVHKLFG